MMDHVQEWAMSGRAVARGVVTLIAAGLVLGAPARANDTAHKMAEKFAGTDGAEAKTKPESKPDAAKQQDKDKAEAAKKKDAERKAAEAKKRAADLKAQAARKAAEAKRKAAEAARRAAEERRADEAEMLARARREAEEMQAAEEHARLTQEARRLIEEAERERAKAEALLASQGEAKRAEAADEDQLARQRMEETRRLAEKLNRVRQIREARLAAQARRKAEEQATAPTPKPQAEPPAAEASPAAKPIEPPAAVAVVPEVRPEPLAVPPAAKFETPMAAGAPPPRAPEIAPDPQPQLQPRVAGAEMAPKTPAEAPAAKLQPAPPEPSLRAPARSSATRVTVLLILQPGNYGIRRRGPKVADPILCVPGDGCWVSAGADQPAVFMPGRRALSFGNALGVRAGACRGALGCVFRGIDLGSVPGYLQPVDLHILKHDRREVYAVLADSGCRAEAGRLSCTHGIYADDYTMWILPESLAAAAGPAALERAVAEGLNGPRSAELRPRR
jgi:colicin import membrane protein